MYRCSVCKRTSKPGEPMRRHVDYRPDGSILHERPLCHACAFEAEHGVPLPVLVERKAPPSPEPAPIPSLVNQGVVGKKSKSIMGKSNLKTPTKKE